MARLRNAYFNCQTEDGRPVPWEPPALPEGVKPDGVFFGEVLARLDGRLSQGGLTFYITQDVATLPRYGKDVVVILIGDEFTRVPEYAGRVLAIFKNLAIRPALTSNVMRDPSWVNLWTLPWYLRTWAYHLPGLAAYRRRRRVGGWVAPIWRLPVGTSNQVPLPVKPVGERAHDLFFAGSIAHEHGAGGSERINPKVLSRREMATQVKRLAARHPELSVELIDTGAFAESMEADALAYSERLMDSRVALVPRGTAIDTLRFWQALRFGCVAVVDAVPHHPRFYDGAPVLRVRGWHELERVVVPLLSDGAALDRLHERSLEWWRTRGSEDALAAYIAERLNRLRRDH